MVKAISANVSGRGGGGGGGWLPPSSLNLTIVFLTFGTLFTYRPIIGLPEYKLKIVNICERHGTGGLEVVVL